QNSYPAARESIGNRCFKRLVIADFVNRLNGSRKIRSVVSEDRSSSADLRQSRWRVRICPEMIVEAPGADRLAQNHHLRRISWISNMRHHAVKRSKGVGDDIAAVFPVNARDRAAAFHQSG